MSFEQLLEWLHFRDKFIWNIFRYLATPSIGCEEDLEYLGTYMGVRSILEANFNHVTNLMCVSDHLVLQVFWSRNFVLMDVTCVLWISVCVTCVLWMVKLYFWLCLWTYVDIYVYLWTYVSICLFANLCQYMYVCEPIIIVVQYVFILMLFVDSIWTLYMHMYQIIVLVVRYLTNN